MKDKVLTYAIVASIAIHIMCVSLVGHTSANRLDSASAAVLTPKFIKVDFVGEPSEALKPKPTPKADPKPAPTQPKKEVSHVVEVTPKPIQHTPTHSVRPVTRPSARPYVAIPHTPQGSGRQMPGNPGGKLNVGSTSANGDLGGNWGGGRTPVGWVPGSDNGKGRGSGSGAGEGRPDPTPHASNGPGTSPAPAPRTVSVRICTESGMLAGEYCKSTATRTYIEGNQPTRVCNKCKAPVHHSTLADHADPILVRDANVSIPSSVEEGLSVVVKVEYMVTDDGSVSGISVLQSSGNRNIDKAAVSATSKLKYKPAIQNGVPRSVKKTRTYRINT